MTLGDSIKTAFSQAFTEAGFRPHGRTWYRDVPIGLLVVDLQKSDWGEQYFINLGVYVRALGDARWPLSNQCQISTRAEVIDVDQQQRWRDLLDLEGGAVNDDLRVSDVAALLRSQVIPFIERLGTEGGVKSAYAAGALSHAGVMLTLKKFLGLDEDNTMR